MLTHEDKELLAKKGISEDRSGLWKKRKWKRAGGL